MIEPDTEPAVHYDRVTAAWRLLLGEELHYGLFERGGEPLDVATAALTELMIAAAELRQGLRVLDVGCGTGAPARRLVRDAGVEVVGITTSSVGVNLAQALADEAGLSGATFHVRDGTDNGFPDASFDRVWILESSHLMPRRDLLLSEAARVLRPGGRVVLCDVIRRREIPFDELRRRRTEFATLRSAFGDARMDRLQDYAAHATAAGLTVDLVRDLSTETLPTFDRWQANASRFENEARATIGSDGLADFVAASQILAELWREGTLGYGLFSAHKAPAAAAPVT